MQQSLTFSSVKRPGEDAAEHSRQSQADQGKPQAINIENPSADHLPRRNGQSNQGRQKANTR